MDMDSACVRRDKRKHALWLHRAHRQKMWCSGASGSIPKTFEDLFGRLDYSRCVVAAPCPGEGFVDVLQNLLNDMHTSGVPLAVSSVSELLATRNGLPREVERNATNTKTIYLRILDKVSVSHRDTLEFYKELKNASLEIRKELREDHAPQPPFLSRILQLCEVLIPHMEIPGTPLTHAEKTSMNARWLALLEHLLIDSCEGTAHSEGWSYDVMVKGDCRYDIEIMPMPSGCGSSDSSDEVIEESTSGMITIPVKPDLTLSANMRFTDGRAREMSIIDFKLETETFDGTHGISPIPSSRGIPGQPMRWSGAEPTSERKRLKTTRWPSSVMKGEREKWTWAAEVSPNTSIDSCTDAATGTETKPSADGLNYEMLYNLLGCIRHDQGLPGARTIKYSAFGVRIVMHKLYLVHLGPTKAGGQKPNCDESARFVNMDESISYHSTTDIWFKMCTFRYLDLFNKDHFQAFMAFLQYLAFHEFNGVADRNIISSQPVGQCYL